MSENLTNEEYQKFVDLGLPRGRIIWSDKTNYLHGVKDYDEAQRAMAIFDAKVGCESRGVIWNGDVDLNTDAGALREIACVIGEPLYIFHENVKPGDCFDEMVGKARYVVVNHDTNINYDKE